MLAVVGTPWPVGGTLNTAARSILLQIPALAHKGWGSSNSCTAGYTRPTFFSQTETRPQLQALASFQAFPSWPFDERYIPVSTHQAQKYINGVIKQDFSSFCRKTFWLIRLPREAHASRIDMHWGKNVITLRDDGGKCMRQAENRGRSVISVWVHSHWGRGGSHVGRVRESSGPWDPGSRESERVGLPHRQPCLGCYSEDDALSCWVILDLRVGGKTSYFYWPLGNGIIFMHF